MSHHWPDGSFFKIKISCCHSTVGGNKAWRHGIPWSNEGRGNPAQGTSMNAGHVERIIRWDWLKKLAGPNFIPVDYISSKAKWFFLGFILNLRVYCFLKMPSDPLKVQKEWFKLHFCCEHVPWFQSFHRAKSMQLFTFSILFDCRVESTSSNNAWWNNTDI